MDYKILWRKNMKDVKFLWCVSKNGLCEPHKVKILKDCPKTYRLDTITDKIVFKVEELEGLVGRNTYCLYYKDKISAYNMYNKIQERDFSISKRDIEKERAIIADLQKTIAEKDKEIKRLKTIKAVENIRTQRTEIDGVEFTTEQISALRNITIINKELIREEIEKEIRYQVCEEIRHKAKWRNPPSQLEFIISAKDLKQIEQGESK